MEQIKFHFISKKLKLKRKNNETDCLKFVNCRYMNADKAASKERYKAGLNFHLIHTILFCKEIVWRIVLEKHKSKTSFQNWSLLILCIKYYKICKSCKGWTGQLFYLRIMVSFLEERAGNAFSFEAGHKTCSLWGGGNLSGQCTCQACFSQGL